MPQGVQSLQIIDDFGDVYGVMLMLTGDDYDYVELKRYADYLTREIELELPIFLLQLASKAKQRALLLTSDG